MLQWFRKQAEDAPADRSGGDLQNALTKKLVEFLSSQISAPKKATSILSRIARFKELPPTYQEKELPSLYLKIERYLVDEDPLQKFSKNQLRKTVKYRYEPLMKLANFSLIFEDQSQQELVLSQFLFKNLILRTTNFVETLGEDFLNRVAEWIYCFPEVKHLTPPFEMQVGEPQSHSELIDLLARFSQYFFQYLEVTIGTDEAAALYEKSYRELVDSYRLLDTFSVVVQLLPDKVLDEQKIGFLSGEQIRNVFLNKVVHLKKVNDELSGKNEALEETKEELIIAQETALESVKLFHGVLDTIEEGIVTLDAKGQIILINKRIQQMFGYKEDELVGHRAEILMPEKYREQHRKGMERYLSTRQSHSMGQQLKLEGLRKDQSIFPIEIVITETQIVEDLYFTAAFRDLSGDLRKESQRKKAADDLRMSEQRLKNYVEASQDIVFTLSLDGSFTSLNSVFEKTTGLTRDEAFGKPFTHIVHPEDSKLALKLFQNVLQGNAVDPTELRIRSGEDNFIYAEMSITPQLQNEKITGAFGFARDISARKRVQEALQRSEDRYRKLRELSPDGLGIHVNGNIVYLTERGAELLGSVDSKQLLNQSLLAFVHPEHRQAFRERMVSILKSGETSQPAIEKFVRIDGEEINLELSSAPIIYKGKRAVQFVFRRAIPAAPAPDASRDADFIRDLLEVLPDAVFVNNLEGEVAAVNQAACDMHGLDRDALIGKSYLQLIPRAERDRVASAIEHMLDSHGEAIETECLSGSGVAVPVEIHSREIEYEGRSATLLIAKDLTPLFEKEHERKKMAGELLQMQSRVKRLGKLVPICASCKNIRDDQGFWMEVGEFSAKPENIELVRGKCPDCTDKDRVAAPEAHKNGATD